MINRVLFFIFLFSMIWCKIVVKECLHSKIRTISIIPNDNKQVRRMYDQKYILIILDESMQKKIFLVCSVLYFILEIILLVVGLTTKNQESIAFVLNVLIVLCMFGISLFFPIRFNILIRYIALLVLWGIHMSIVMGTNLWDNSSCASIFMGLFAQHFILTIASSLPSERLNLNKYLFFIELLVCLISLSVFPLSIPLLIFKDESTQLIVVSVLGSLTFVGEIGIAIFKHFKLEQL